MLRCLSQAPRLPAMDWGAIIRRCMRYEAQVAKLLLPDPGLEKGSVREECLRFSISHANQFDPLLSFLDELSDLARFRTLELNLQCCLLVHFADLIKLFSGSRLEKLFDDLTNYLSSITLQQVYDTDNNSMICISFWKGLHRCLEEVSLDSLEYISHAEKCMEVLFSLLPSLPQSTAMVQVVEVNFTEEWSEAVSCLGKARRSWLLDYLQVYFMVFIYRFLMEHFFKPHSIRSSYDFGLYWFPCPPFQNSCVIFVCLFAKQYLQDLRN